MAAIDASPEQVDQPARLLNGLAFSNLTVDQPDGYDPAGLIDRVFDAVFSNKFPGSLRSPPGLRRGCPNPPN
ncbi:hypothetical protein ACQ856_05545 [Mycolicibacterium psychrotolerans]|uniref:hypothetical protein n=1 Tax=Mycolicibacterium psychrotolerans TaxID=216929 RepID=UPI003D6782AF